MPQWGSKWYFPLAIVVALVLLITSIALLVSYKQTVVINTALSKDYKDCDENGTPCKKLPLSLSNPCTCYLQYEIKETMSGSVGLYYELETFDQTRSDYKESKDDMQLAGHLSPTPAKSCGNYSYNEEKPIAPCGAIADTMFTDRFDLIYLGDYVSCRTTDLDGISEEDRKLFRNPEGDLKEAFQNFSRPKSWQQNIWDLDKTNASNNGFQNEGFIAWMKTDLKRKPICQIVNNIEHGLQAGNYTLRVEYSYPYSIYQGPRTVIIASSRTEIQYSLVCLILGILFLIAWLALCIGIYWMRKFKLIEGFTGM